MRTLYFTCLFFLIAFLFSGCQPVVNQNAQPNIVLIFVDDMGYGDLSCYGSPTIQTPHLDQMANEGMRFTSFCAAASVCTPSRGALLTGRYPIRHLPNNCGPESDIGLPLSEITLADILSEQGYATTAIGKWHLGHLPKFLPTSRGFDSYYGLAYSNDMILPWCPWLDDTYKLEMYQDTLPIREIGFEQDNITVDYTNKAVEYIRGHQDQPFFLYLAHNMPHLPIATADQFRGTSKGGLYGDVVQTLDWSVGQVLATLKETGLDENTLVVFASDNGPWHNLPDRMLQNGVQRWHSGSTGLLRGSKNTTYEGGYRVPAIVRWPGQIDGQQTCLELATTMDVFTTLVQAGGGKLPDDREIDGQDLMPLLRGTGKAPTQSLFYHKGSKLEALREGAWKLRFTEADGKELYHIEQDPSEAYNLAEDQPERVNKLLARMQTFASQTGAEMDSLSSGK